jgi:hypothetical protein
VNTPVAKVRTKRAFAQAERPLNLEIGGVSPRDGWIVTNVNAVTKNFMDATVTWPLEDASCRYVFSDNVIEHITLGMARAMFAESYRCLQPGGVIRVVTPDIRKHIEMYLAGTGTEGHVAEHYRGMGLTVEHPIDMVRIPIGSFGHHTGYVYDFQTMEAELKRAGFHSIVECNLGESGYPELAALDIRTNEGGAQLAVEAVR